MDLHELRKAATERTELEYLFAENQWVPATVSLLHEHASQWGSGTSITLQLLSHPRNHSGIVSVNSEDLKHRLRIKGSH